MVGAVRDYPPFNVLQAKIKWRNKHIGANRLFIDVVDRLRRSVCHCRPKQVLASLLFV